MPSPLKFDASAVLQTYTGMQHAMRRGGFEAEEERLSI
jgi:hypothetical protein